MRTLILRSKENQAAADAYSSRLDTRYADRVIGHLSDTGSYCSACGEECIKCRSRYDISYAHEIAGVLDFPGRLPALLDDPKQYLPASVPDHIILLAISVHEEILMAFLNKFPLAQGVVVPREAPDWISPHGMQQVADLCQSQNIQVEFPKPFCSFNPSSGVLSDFKVYTKMGKPDIRYTIRDNTIAEARVLCSAPCGATYYTARGLEGKSVTGDLAHFIDLRQASFPCTASTKVDRDLGDSIIHESAKIQRNILKSLV